MPNLQKFVALKCRFLWVCFLAFLLTLPLSVQAEEKAYRVLKGVFHIHSQYSHDSNASLSYILEIARELNADFVVITEHNNQDGKAVYKQKVSDSEPLLLFGNEVSVPEGHLIALNVSGNPPQEARVTAEELIKWIDQQGGYAILAHPWSRKEPWKNLSLEGWDGFELYNFADEIREESWGLLIDSHFSKDHDDVLDQTQEVSKTALRFWDTEMKKRGPIPAFAGTNAHFRRYKKEFKMSLESMSQYVWSQEKTPESITEALGQGRGFLVFERGISLKDFFFGAVKDDQRVYPGSSVTLDTPASLTANLPDTAEIVFIKDGIEIKREMAQTLSVALTEPGIYRAEVFLEGKPWIYTNAIQVTTADTSEGLN